MIFKLVLHEVHALAFYRVGDNHGWEILLGSSIRKRRSNLREIMAVDFVNIPAKRPEFFGKWMQIEYVFNVPQTLNFVVVHDRHKIVQLMMAGKQNGLPV